MPVAASSIPSEYETMSGRLQSHYRQYVGHSLMFRQSTAAARLLYWFARSARPEHSQPLTGQPQNRDGEFVKQSGAPS
jgi:hypothetical protein